MSALQNALNKLDASITKLEGTVDYFEELNQVQKQAAATKASTPPAASGAHPDMFATPPASNSNSAEIAKRLDSAIDKVEKILADGSTGK